MENDLQDLLPKAERDLVVEGLQALWRERKTALHTSEVSAQLHGGAPLGWSDLGLDQVGEILRRFGSVPQG